MNGRLFQLIQYPRGARGLLNFIILYACIMLKVKRDGYYRGNFYHTKIFIPVG